MTGSLRIYCFGCGQLSLNAGKTINVIFSSLSFPASLASSQSSRQLLRLLLMGPAEPIPGGARSTHVR